MSELAVHVRNVSKSFTLHTEKRNSLKERLVRGPGHTDGQFWALKDVSFDVPRGTTFGLIGHNGSGKSTMLKLLAGVHRPTSGQVDRVGRLAALLELGAGFHGELTGRENIYLNGAILGLSRKQIAASMDKIVDFAGIGDFIDSPVKVYSSGMYVRLGFSIAVTIEPELLIVDEIIAVGDEEFQRKCFDHLFALRQRGTTIILVSHAMSLVQDLCDRALWLDHGRIADLGDARTVVQGYMDAVNSNEAADGPTEPAEVEAPTRLGSGEVRITGLEYLDEHGNVAPVLLSGEPGGFRIHYEAKEPLRDVVFGIGFVHETGTVIAGPNSGFENEPVVAELRERGSVEFRVDQLTLQPGNYLLSAGAADRGHVYDQIIRGFQLKVRGVPGTEPGFVRMFGAWSEGAKETAAMGHTPAIGEGNG